MQTPRECLRIVGSSIDGVNSFPCHGQSAAIVTTIGARPTAARCKNCFSTQNGDFAWFQYSDFRTL
eukprot:10854109-Alexandrium_andersonii.AAC.1